MAVCMVVRTRQLEACKPSLRWAVLVLGIRQAMLYCVQAPLACGAIVPVHGAVPVTGDAGAAATSCRCRPVGQFAPSKQRLWIHPCLSAAALLGSSTTTVAACRPLLQAARSQQRTWRLHQRQPLQVARVQSRSPRHRLTSLLQVCA